MAVDPLRRFFRCHFTEPPHSVYEQNGWSSVVRVPDGCDIMQGWTRLLRYTLYRRSSVWFSRGKLNRHSTSPGNGPLSVERASCITDHGQRTRSHLGFTEGGAGDANLNGDCSLGPLSKHPLYSRIGVYGQLPFAPAVDVLGFAAFRSIRPFAVSNHPALCLI